MSSEMAVSRDANSASVHFFVPTSDDSTGIPRGPISDPIDRDNAVFLASC
jgi:hypothetical protein